MHPCMNKLIYKLEEPAFQALMDRLHPHLPKGKPTYTDYEMGLLANYRYMEQDTPEVLEGGLRIMEIGPGVGAWLLLAREMGNTVFGEDLPIRHGGNIEAYPEGDERRFGAYTDAYACITKYWGLDVRYRGFHRFMLDPFDPEHISTGELCAPGTLDMIHSRGSLSGVLNSYGQVYNPPEISNQCQLEQIPAAAHSMLSLAQRALKKLGQLVISHNAGAPADAFCDYIKSKEFLGSLDIPERGGFHVIANDPLYCRLVKA